METSKKGKSKTLSDRLKRYVEFFRTLPDTQRTEVQFEDQKEPEKVPARPTDFWLRNAGGYVHRLLRLGCFKEDKQELLSGFYKGGKISIWKEMVTNLRARVNLPYTRDYLQTFAEDCQLVADALEKEIKDADVKTLQKPPKKKYSAEDRLIFELIQAMRNDHYTPLTRICKNAVCSTKHAYKCEKFLVLYDDYLKTYGRRARDCKLR